MTAMKKNFVLFVFLLFLISFSQSVIFAKTDSDEKWIRVRSDNGEFSIEIPVKHNYFHDNDGLLVSDRYNNYSLKKMDMLNAFQNNTLLSFESYEAKKKALESIYEMDKSNVQDTKTTTIRRGNATIKQLVIKTDIYFCVRQYFSSKNSIYVLTAATRNEENETMKRFLDSLIFNPDSKETPNTTITAYTSLKITAVNLIASKKENENTPVNSAAAPIKKEKSKLVLISKPRCSYTDAARMKAVQGIIRMRINFAEDGFIPDIEIIEGLPEGLLRQAIFAALRMKFIPDEKDGEAVPLKRVVEYSFTIY